MQQKMRYIYEKGQECSFLGMNEGSVSSEKEENQGGEDKVQIHERNWDGKQLGNRDSHKPGKTATNQPQDLTAG